MAAEAPERLAYSRVYRLHVGLAVAGLVTITGTVLAALTAVSVAPAGGRELEVAGGRVGYPAINASAVVLLALALLGAAVIVICLREAWREAAGQRALLRSLSVVGPLPGHSGVLVIADESARAFCAGYVRPRVYVSTGALAVLAPRELDAVLAHEQRHRSTRDPLRLACGRILNRGLFFLPALRPLHERHGALSELRADAAALGASDRAALASAMLMLGDRGSGEVVGISPERVDRLLGHPLALRIPSILLAASLAIVAALMAVVWRVSAVASVKTTLALPIVSSKPCVLALALVPVAVALGRLATKRAV